jgi:hypothetical protein
VKRRAPRALNSEKRERDKPVTGAIGFARVLRDVIDKKLYRGIAFLTIVDLEIA